ncbi:MAG: hypothetical protein CMI08_18355 [Oceanospirillaceae bacterium]|uniref:hypothetical protein n=1 Tax=unclassified Thalassolituus TaxID=2624967 RepID=UPI000C09482E|nr:MULTISPECIES: hypothetical protein [unclassified Thalassolituus]MAK90207.1 hypothetical protein [Thalassolituus sp.]MAS25901.1 hypothetical protein [Oceanospirillaceae bacterium]MAY01127.1 hypothetical protein [Oceanospirillaceae bacterium]MBL36457.1 hypothetical protein [Oceanospirillaceae bacterium]MBS52178.1 hypothetical protein [Oceanospirillaceae bacterium]|tara:strand:+ start:6220 stop:6561 length:342 start_codon:yes stop_codon:yes gene_type:complete
MECRRVGLAAVFLCASGCSTNEGYPSQASHGVRNLGDTINHCRNYTEYHVEGSPVISLDSLSTRREERYYEVFLNLNTKEDSGWAHCRITMAGDIRVHRIHNFGREGNFFGLF